MNPDKLCCRSAFRARPPSVDFLPARIPSVLRSGRESLPKFTSPSAAEASNPQCPQNFAPTHPKGADHARICSWGNRRYRSAVDRGSPATGTLRDRNDHQRSGRRHPPTSGRRSRPRQCVRRNSSRRRAPPLQTRRSNRRTNLAAERAKRYAQICGRRPQAQDRGWRQPVSRGRRQWGPPLSPPVQRILPQVRARHPRRRILPSRRQRQPRCRCIRAHLHRARGAPVQLPSDRGGIPPLRLLLRPRYLVLPGRVRSQQPSCTGRFRW